MTFSPLSHYTGLFFFFKSSFRVCSITVKMTFVSMYSMYTCISCNESMFRGGRRQEISCFLKRPCYHIDSVSDMSLASVAGDKENSCAFV